ncbi:sensor histidine kinase [Streptomyces puniciscabiei]
MVAALVVEIIIFPPRQNAAASLATAAAYALWSLILLALVWLKGIALPPGLPILIDLVALTTLLATSGGFSDPEWASPLVNDVFLVIPVLAAFQLLPRFTAAASLAAVVVYVGGIGLGHRTSNPYWHFTLVHALFIAVVGAGAVILSIIQQSRVRTIASFAHQRSWLLSRVMSAEERERSDLAGILHDGALQTVLAARHDVDEAALEHPSEALDRAARTLRDATAQLRSSVTALHSEALEHGGLAVALQGMADQVAQRAHIAVTVDCEIATAGSADRPLYRAARELLANVVKHAQARNVSIRLTASPPGCAELEIADDGVGIAPGMLEQQIAAGHVGLASHRTRIQGAGGRFALRPNSPRGTVATVVMPMASDSDSERSASAANI